MHQVEKSCQCILVPGVLDQMRGDADPQLCELSVHRNRLHADAWHVIPFLLLWRGHPAYRHDFHVRTTSLPRYLSAVLVTCIDEYHISVCWAHIRFSSYHHNWRHGDSTYYGDPWEVTLHEWGEYQTIEWYAWGCINSPPRTWRPKWCDVLQFAGIEAG